MDQAEDALVGTAMRAVISLLPQYGQVIVRLDVEARTAVVDAQLAELSKRQLVALPVGNELRNLLSGKAEMGPREPVRELPGPLLIEDVVRAALLAPVVADSSGFFDMLWDAAVTLFGVFVGESIGGPAGAAAAGFAAHTWAQQHPPSTWFE